jgi:hypothetical protein
LCLLFLLLWILSEEEPEQFSSQDDEEFNDYDDTL